ncbi:MAG: response regulator transcription factor [Salinivirgaceae bacterium]|nr:response regulator transcription factor [Salinivirgaceae bacterium]
MIKALIVDDEANNRNNLESLLNKYCQSVEIIGSADSVDSAFNFIRNNKPDLVFLDIKMPKKDGFELLESLNEINFEVIIVTAYYEYAIKAIKFCALDYLLKPIDIIELTKAVDKAAVKIGTKKENDQLKYFVYNLKNASKKIALTDNDKIEFVETNEIIHIVGDNNYSNVFLNSGKKKLITKTLKEFETLLTEHGFLRVHKSHLINSKYIKSYYKNDGGYIILTNDAKIPISRTKKNEILKLIKG